MVYKRKEENFPQSFFRRQELFELIPDNHVYYSAYSAQRTNRSFYEPRSCLLHCYSQALSTLIENFPWLNLFSRGKNYIVAQEMLIASFLTTWSILIWPIGPK